jgi:uncharacterized lipoprotein
MQKLIIAATALALLAACSNLYTYVKPDADVERTQADLRACNSEANPYTGDAAKEALDKCMADRGYTKQVESYRF